MITICSWRPPHNSVNCSLLVWLSLLLLLLCWFHSIDLTCDLWLTERSPPIEEVIQSGVVPRFVEFLMREDFPQLQVWEWCLITLFVPSLAFHVVASHLLYRCGYAFIVWSCLGSHKHCFWYLGEHQSGDWSWGGANFCKASGFSKWWCPWAGVFWKWVDPYAV